MNGFEFTPDEDKNVIEVPYFEDARADFAPYYSSTASLPAAELQVTDELIKLGAQAPQVISGRFGNDPVRYGYVIRYTFHGIPGAIRVAGLPIKRPTPVKIERSKVQALLNVRDWLKAAVTQMVFSPGSNPLLQHLLVDGRRTVTEYMAETGRLPSINRPLLLEGEVVDDDE